MVERRDLNPHLSIKKALIIVSKHLFFNVRSQLSQYVKKVQKNGNLTDTIPIFALFFYFFETGRTETMPLPKR